MGHNGSSRLYYNGSSRLFITIVADCSFSVYQRWWTYLSRKV